MYNMEEKNCIPQLNRKKAEKRLPHGVQFRGGVLLQKDRKGSHNDSGQDSQKV